MNRNLLVTALIATAAFGSSFAASAQTNAANTTQRDVNQEQRIENGLQNGSITTRENSELQRDEAHVDHLQAKDMKNGDREILAAAISAAWPAIGHSERRVPLDGSASRPGESAARDPKQLGDQSCGN